MAGGIVPESNVKKILSDPLGVKVIKSNEVYSNPNRYFAHSTFYSFYRSVPLLLQNFVSAVNSVYLATALFKTFLLILYIFFISEFCNIGKKRNYKNMLISMAILLPLFQVNGYRSYIGIIDPSPTYTFFYAFPLLILLIFIFILYSQYRTKESFSLIKVSILTFLSFFLALSGPLIPGIILVFSLTLLLRLMALKIRVRELYMQNKEFYKVVLFIFCFTNLLCLYSLLIAKNNTILISNQLPLLKRYYNLPIGLFNILTGKIAFLILFTQITIAIYFIKKINVGYVKIKNFLNFCYIFIFLYILLLPLGGYKDYRPYIIRYDTFMPITVLLFLIYVVTNYYVYRYYHMKDKFIFYISLIASSIVFINADKFEIKNSCEVETLNRLSKFERDTFLIDPSCNFLNWSNNTNSRNQNLNSELLLIWRITKTKKVLILK